MKPTRQPSMEEGKNADSIALSVFYPEGTYCESFGPITGPEGEPLSLFDPRTGGRGTDF
jgi:hypothetical protein